MKHRTKGNDCFSANSNVECNVPQDSILGPLLFNIHMIDLFHECKENDIENYDDTTHFHVLLTLSLPFPNYRLSQQQKFLIFLSIIMWKQIQLNMTYYYHNITSIDSVLKFENHLSAICNKVRRKINALGQIVNYRSLEERSNCDEKHSIYWISV